MRLFLTSLLAVAVVAPAAAQSNACYDRVEGGYPANTYLNAVVTDQWRASQQTADPAAMAEMSGLWYGEIHAPQLGMVDYQYRSFEPNGLFQYQSQTCSLPGIPCSQNYGTGEWTAHKNRDGSFAVMFHFSDVSRTEACGGFTAMIGGAVMRAHDGTVWQRQQ
ncbi:MAG: hypothetical protein IT535_13565 [Bauldia sp.]|nr:hypothetical protein [Bauldia sp.]